MEETDSLNETMVETHLTEPEKLEMEEEQTVEQQGEVIKGQTMADNVDTLLNETEVDNMITTTKQEFEKKKKVDPIPNDLTELRRMFEESKDKLDFMLDIDNLQILDPKKPTEQINLLAWLKSARSRFYDDEYWHEVGVETIEVFNQLISYFRQLSNQKNLTWQVFMTVLSVQSNRLAQEEENNLIFRQAMIDRIGELRKQVNYVRKLQSANKIVNEEISHQKEVVTQIERYQERGEKFANASFQDFIDDGCTEKLWAEFKREMENRIARYIANPKTNSITFMFNMFSRDRNACEWKQSAYIQVLMANEKALKERFKPSNVEDTLRKFVELELPR